jgi:hypothetical protein
MQRSCLGAMLLPIALLAFGPVVANAHLILVSANNYTCFADRVGDNLRPAWNAPFTGEEVVPPAADPESSGPIDIYFDDLLSETSRSIGDDYFDWLDLYVTGLSLGQSVRIERFLVDNDLGVVNANAVLMESHLVQDGFLPLTGKIPNLNSVEDWDEERDGSIWTQLGMFGGLANMPGEYVIRVSSPLSSFTPATARLTIDEVPTDQFFHGQVVDDQGSPIPGAFVALLQPLGSYSEILFAARADAEGRYRLYAPSPDEVDMVAVAPGYVGPFQIGASRVIDSDEELEHDIALMPGTVTLSGQALRSDTNEPLAGLPVSFLTSDDAGEIDGRLMTHTWTDANGAFSVQVTPDRWVALVKTYEAASRNIVAPGYEPQLRFNVTDGNDLTGIELHFKPSTCVIAGFLEGEDGEQLNQVQVTAINRETNESTSGFTLENGSFTLPATPGKWEVSPMSFDLEVAGYPGVMTTRVRLTAPNQSVVIGNIAMELNAILEGTITYESSDPEKDGKPVGGLTLWAQNIDNNELVSVFQSTYNFNGYYNIYLSEGEWFVIPAPREAVQRQLLLKNLPRLEVFHDDFMVEEIEWDIVAVDPERMMEIRIEDANGNPVAGISMHAHMMDGMETYDAFGITDANGVATIPGRAGHWHFHVSGSALREAGFSQMPEPHLMVPSDGEGPVPLLLTATPFGGTPAKFTATERAWDNIIFRGTGEPGQLYEVEGSFDLNGWFYAGRVIALGGEFAVTDELDAGHQESITGEPGQSVFYRLKEPQ